MLQRRLAVALLLYRHRSGRPDLALAVRAARALGLADREPWRWPTRTRASCGRR